MGRVGDDPLTHSCAASHRQRDPDDGEVLTSLGVRLAELPLAPRLGKMVLLGIFLGCLDPVLTIACMMG